jgi:hypothetical protein
VSRRAPVVPEAMKVLEMTFHSWTSWQRMGGNPRAASVLTRISEMTASRDDAGA